MSVSVAESRAESEHLVAHVFLHIFNPSVGITWVLQKARCRRGAERFSADVSKRDAGAALLIHADKPACQSVH